MVLHNAQEAHKNIGLALLDDAIASDTRSLLESARASLSTVISDVADPPPADARSEEETKARLEYLREQIRDESISMGEIVELQGMADAIDPSDVELLEWAGVPEHEPEVVAAREWLNGLGIVTQDMDDPSVWHLRNELLLGRYPDDIALDIIAHMLRNPEWYVSMLEDLAEIVKNTGRSLDNPDEIETWGKH